MQHPRSNIAFIGLGSNVGDREKHLCMAHHKIREADIVILQKSRIYESTAWGYKNQSKFLNQVIKVETELNPEGLLTQLQSIEQELGRKRRPKWHEREIDLDILFFGQAVIDAPGLSIPHRHWKERKFVLIPLIEIAGNFTDPETGKSPIQILNETSDTSEVFEYKALP